MMVPKRKKVATRGIYEDDIALPGERWFKIVTSSGKIARLQFPVELIDRRFTENLWRHLDAQDPPVSRPLRRVAP